MPKGAKKQKILLLIKHKFLLFLYQKLFESNGFEVVSANTPKKIYFELQNNNFNLIIFGMHLGKTELKELVYKALVDRIPVLIFIMDETKDALEDHLKFDQYVYIDILNDHIHDIVKKARKLMAKYRVAC